MHINDAQIAPLETDFFLLKHFKIISGGQNGADQAGLFAAKQQGITTGGTAPQDWVTLDGPMPELLSSFGLKPCVKPGYPPRTEMNVFEGDVTLRFASHFGSTGEKCTFNAIKKYKRPFIDFDVPEDLTIENAHKLAKIIVSEGHHIVNVAGNSEKTSPGITVQVQQFMSDVLIEIKNLCNK